MLNQKAPLSCRRHWITEFAWGCVIAISKPAPYTHNLFWFAVHICIYLHFNFINRFHLVEVTLLLGFMIWRVCFVAVWYTLVSGPQISPLKHVLPLMSFSLWTSLPPQATFLLLDNTGMFFCFFSSSEMYFRHFVLITKYFKITCFFKLGDLRFSMNMIK